MTHSSAVDVAAVRHVVETARASGRDRLLEREGLAIAALVGLDVPVSLHARDAAEAARLDTSALPGERVVLKAVVPELAHKTEAGAVAVVSRSELPAAAAKMERRLRGQSVLGFTLSELVRHDGRFGSELLIGLRWTDDFGPVVALGPGGTATELLAGRLAPDRGLAILTPELPLSGRAATELRRKAVSEALSQPQRGQPARLPFQSLIALLERWLDLARRCVPELLREIEINPVAVVAGRLVALDAVARVGSPAPACPAPRPLDKLRRLLQPRSIGLVGVSRRNNPGRIILSNLLRDGFAAERIAVIKHGLSELAGCRCYPDLDALPEPVDLLVLAVDAAQVPELVESAIAGRRAESLIVIPGGLGERAGSEGLERRVRRQLDAARASDWRGPVINGGNCLGIRSHPGRYDTLFLPGHKFPTPGRHAAPLAVISQSGALAAALATHLEELPPRYLISYGNQTDLTAGDYLEHLADDPELGVFACYVEGFRPLDGARWLRAARRIVESGRSVILYRAGRSPAAAQVAASHTAALAGDYAVTRELARAAGVDVAESLADLTDLTRLRCLLSGRSPGGTRLGALSNAGFECVALADALGPFELARFSPATSRRLERILARSRLGGVVAVSNPLDVTPMLSDAAFAEAVRVILSDDGVDVAVFGCVPMTPALETLPPGPDHGEDLARATAIAPQLVELFRTSIKPFVVVVDAGRAYHPLVARLRTGHVPVVGSADRALELLGRLYG